MDDGVLKSTGARPTQKTIANVSGFAVTTVSRALAGDPLIARKTREKIAKIADELGYVPDRAAQRLRTGRTNVIALVLDPHGEIMDFSGSMAAGFAEVIRDTKFHLNLTHYQLGEDPMRPIKHIVHNKLADGLVFARTKPNDPRVAYLLKTGFPFVTHGRTELEHHAWYDFDNAAFARLAVARLAQKGRRDLLLIPPSALFTFAGHMVGGFEAALTGNGIKGSIPDGIDLNTAPEDLHHFLTELLRRPDRPDGLICPGEIPALAALAAIDDAGLKLGTDIDIVSKQTSHVFDLLRPRIETIYEDLVDAGRIMARALLDQIDGVEPETLQNLQTPKPDF